MRNVRFWATTALWLAVATLMPMAALEPVASAHAAEAPAEMVALCADGSANLAMGCEGIHL